MAKGVYTFHNDITVVGFAFKPFYYGLENALTILKLWDQNTNPVVITWKNVRAGERKFGDGNYLVQRLAGNDSSGTSLSDTTISLAAQCPIAKKP